MTPSDIARLVAQERGVSVEHAVRIGMAFAFQQAANSVRQQQSVGATWHDALMAAAASLEVESERLRVASTISRVG